VQGRRIRPAGSGQGATATPYARTVGVSSGLLVTSVPTGIVRLLDDWPQVALGDRVDMSMTHAVGWNAEISLGSSGAAASAGSEIGTAEVRLLNPLGEGVLSITVDALEVGWLGQVRAERSIAMLIDAREPSAGATEGDPAVGDPVLAATVRTGVSEETATPVRPGRNEPCHCGSGRKFKHCHGR